MPHMRAFLFLLAWGTAAPAMAQQALPLPRVEFEMEARAQDMTGTAILRHRGGILRFEVNADGARMVMLQNLTSGEVRGQLEEAGQRMALPSAAPMLPWAGARARREGEARVANEACTLWRIEDASRGVLCLTADGVPLRYQEPVTAGLGGDVQHFNRRPPAGTAAMETMFEAVRVTRRAQSAALFDMASLPAAQPMPVAPPGAGMPGGMTAPGMTIPGMPPGMTIPGVAPQAAPAPVSPPAAAAAPTRSNPADFARHPRPPTGRGSLPANVTAAEAGQAAAAQIGQLVMLMRLCGWAEVETGFKGAFGLQTHERLGFTPQDAAHAYDQASSLAAEMLTAFTANPQAATMIRLQACQPSARDDLRQSIGNGSVF